MSPLTVTDPIRSQLWLGYIFAVLLSVAALILRMWLGAALTGFPFVTFFGAVILAAFLGGTGPGSATAILSAGFAAWFYMIPEGLFAEHAPAGWIGLSFYAATNAVILLLMHGVLVAHRLHQRTSLRLATLNDELESRVLVRTRELEAQVREREAAEAKLRQLQKLESVGQLTGGIAHDFNNMLSIIVGSLDLALRRSEGASPAMIRNVDNAMDGAKRAAALTARLLAFSRQQTLAPEVIDPNKFVATVCELLQRTLGEQIELETVLAGGLWRTYADAGELQNAIVNLAVNARDAMSGQGKLTIETVNSDIDEAYAAANKDAAVGQYVLICVTDNGSGMSDETRQKVFEPFFTTKEVGQGIGLGLSQVYGFVKQTGGHVQIYSEVGQGTTIKLYLPRWLKEDGEDLRPRAELPAPARAVPGETILAVEDDDGVRQVTGEALRELGYIVVEASSPAEALPHLDSPLRIDVLFTDVVMPGMTGRELARLGLSRRPELKVLYTTGYTRNAIVHHGVLERGVALLQKPFTVNHLAAKLREVIG